MGRKEKGHLRSARELSAHRNSHFICSRGNRQFTWQFWANDDEIWLSLLTMGKSGNSFGRLDDPEINWRKERLNWPATVNFPFSAILHNGVTQGLIEPWVGKVRRVSLIYFDENVIYLHSLQCLIERCSHLTARSRWRYLFALLASFFIPCICYDHHCDDRCFIQWKFQFLQIIFSLVFAELWIFKAPHIYTKIVSYTSCINSDWV